ncbi:MAG: hypothetical protein ACO3UU_00110 [Minisyncoccia bacterium]
MKTITILTCDRQPSYLADTVATIPEDYAIQYVAQGQIVQPRAGNLIPVDKKYKQDETRHRDSQYNYARALLTTKDGLIIEDDVKLSRYFDKALNEVIRNIPTARYAVALYSCYNWTQDNFNEVIAKYPINMFYGTQAMLYDIETAREFGAYLLENIGREPYDLALKTFIKTVNPEVVLYASKLSLVQHIGDVSTGLGNGHQCFNFLDDVKL